MTKSNNKSELTAEQSQQVAFAQDQLKDYQFTRFIASGGMGSVYLAEDIRLQRPAAIKIIEVAPQTDGLKEAQTLARLNHPNIVQIYQLVSKNQQMALVMEYLPGKTLQQCLREQLIPLALKLQWLCQISSGLAAAHDAGIIHCDLKLSNVLLDENNTVKITDFGIAQNAHLQSKDKNYTQPTDQTSRGSMVSMSPEQLQNHPIDFRSDLFSLGILAFQMIVGQHPFAGGQVTGSAAQMGKRIVESNPMDASEVAPALPPTLVKLLNQLLNKNPQQRPQSSSNVAQRFSQILTTVTQQEILNQDTEVFDESVATAVKKPKINKRMLLAAAGVLLAISAAFIMYVGKNAEQPVRYIAVLQPSYTATDGTNPSQKDWLRGTIDEAIRQSIMSSKGLQLISRKEVKAIDGSVKMIGEATGATDILTTEFDCDLTRCNVTLSQLGGKNWAVQKRQHWVILTENFSTIYQTSLSHFAELYPQAKDNAVTQHPINEQDHLKYIKLYHQVTYEGIRNEAALIELKQVLTSSPHLIGGYQLFREVTRYLYSQNEDKKYPQQLKQLMQAAPPQYRYSIAQTIDAFWLAITLNDLDEAKKQLEVAEQRGIYETQLIELKAHWFKANNELTQSVAYFQKLLKLRPSAATEYNLALSYVWKSEFAPAKIHLQNILRIMPNDYDTNQMLGAIALFEGDIKQAIIAFEKIVVKDPKSSDLSNLGLAYSLIGQHKKALKFAELAVKKNPQHPTWILNFADALSVTGQPEQARIHYQQVIKRHEGKKGTKSWLEKAQALVHIDENEAAIKALNQAKKLAPNNGEVAFTAALVYAQLDEQTSAVAQIEEALAKDIGIVWFNLPWFDRLCDNQQFIRVMTKNGNSTRCANYRQN